MEEETRLVRCACGGDREAFEELVRLHTPLVYACQYGETGDVQRAEDLVQETWLRAFRAIRRLKEPDRFRGWLMRVARSAAVDAFRSSSRKRRSAPGSLRPEMMEIRPAPQGEDAERREERERVRAHVQSLPEEYRLPLLMRYLHGADYATLTARLGMNDDQLRGLLYRGMKLLREAVKKEESHESRRR